MAGKTMSSLERAFQLARSGKCHSIADIRHGLRAEGYDERQIEGPSLSRQLRELMKAAEAPGAMGPP